MLSRVKKELIESKSRCVFVVSPVDSAREVSSPMQQYYHHHSAFRPIIDVYANSLSARADIRSPGQNCRQWSMAANYLDDDGDDGPEDAWGAVDEDCNSVMRHYEAQQPPAYSHYPPQHPAYRRQTPVSPAPILRPDNYTLKRPRPAAVDVPGDESSQYEQAEAEANGHLLMGAGFDAEPSTIIGGDTTDSGYSLQRSTAPPSPAPLDNV